MSLVLCLEDAAGRDANVEVRRDDDFEAFLARAEAALGYRPRLADVTEGRSVALTDNAYDFMIATEMATKDPPPVAEVKKEEVKREAAEDYDRVEYLEEDSEQSDIMDVEMLDEDFQEEREDDGDGDDDDKAAAAAAKKRKWDVAHLAEQMDKFEDALSDLLRKEPEPVEPLDGDDAKPAHKARVLVPKMTEALVERCIESPALEIPRFLAANPPIYRPPRARRGAYFDEVMAAAAPSTAPSLLKIRAERPTYLDELDDPMYVPPPPPPKLAAPTPPILQPKRRRGRPRKGERPPEPAPKKREPESDLDDDDDDDDYDSPSEYTAVVAKLGTDDPEDTDYVPGQKVDWGKPKKPKERYDCRMCGDVLPKMRLAVTHALTHRISDKEVYPCILCAYAYSTHGELQRHMKSEHKKKKSKRVPPPRTPGSIGKSKNRPGRKPKSFMQEEFKIEIIDNEEVCNLEVLEEWLEDDDYDEPDLQSELKYYIEEDHKDGIHRLNIKPGDDTKQIKSECESHEESMSDDEDEEYQIEDEYRMGEESDGGRKKSPKRKRAICKTNEYKCKVCSNSYPSHDSLAKHQCRSAVKQRLRMKYKNRCALCGETFASSTNLNLHMTFHRIDLVEMNRVCKRCPDSKFSDEAQLFEHLNQEHSENFPCEHPGCDREFCLRSALRAHARTHGRKSHTCATCGKQFFDIHNLNEHKITHLPVKPYQCHICHKFLNRKTRLRMHLLSHESSPFENAVICCKYCKMAFKDAEEAEEHISQSAECCKNILANIAEIQEGDVKQEVENDPKDDSEDPVKFFIEPYVKEPTSSVEDFMSESLVKNGLICTPLIGDQIMDGGAEMIDMLIEEEGELKIILKEKMGQGGGISEGNEILNDAIKNEPNNEGSGLKDTLLENSADDPKDLSENVSKIINEMAPQRVITSVEELTSQLGQSARMFCDVLKIKMAFRCEYCENVYYTKEALIEHRMIHDGVRHPFSCNMCSASFATYARRTSHKSTHGYFKGDSSEDQVRVNIDALEIFPVIKYFLCQSCNKTFLHWTYLQVHKRHKHGKETYYFNCKICGEKFTDSWSLNMHRRKKHADILAQRGTTKSRCNYICDDCGAGFTKRVKLAKHRANQHSDSSLISLKKRPGPYTCTECGKEYQTKNGMEGHMRAHNGNAFLCDLCGTNFVNRLGLERHHKRVHLKQNEKVCPDCGMTFFFNADLETHRRCHTGAKPFQCEYCDMAFRTKGRRSEHHRTHTGERPFPCDVCGTSFRRSNALKNHRLTHSGDPRHVCPFCPKHFHVHSNLKNHIKLKHPADFVVLEVKGGKPQDSLETSLKLFAGSDNSLLLGSGAPQEEAGDVQQQQPQQQQPAMAEAAEQMLVFEDVIIEDESEGMLRSDGANILGYTYATTEDIQMQQNIEFINDMKQDSKIQIQFMDDTDSGHSLLYTVDGSVADTDLRLIGNEVTYTLVDDISEDPKTHFTIIDGDQFSKEEVGGDGHMY